MFLVNIISMQYVAYLDEKMPEKSDPLYCNIIPEMPTTTKKIHHTISIDSKNNKSRPLYIYDSRIVHVITIYERYYKLYYSFPFLTLHYFIAVYLIIPIVYLYW